MTEYAAARQWISGLLAGDSGTTSVVSTRIYRDQAPQGAALPHVIYAELLPDDDEVNGIGDTVAANLQYEIYCVGTNETNVLAMADRIQALFGGTTGTASPWSLGSWRLKPVEDPPEKFGPNTIYRAGGLYRVLATL